VATRGPSCERGPGHRGECCLAVRLRIPVPSLVVLCGPAGSGKTTFAARHFPPTAIVSSDRCRAMLGDDERNLAVSRDAFELFHFIIARRLALGRLAVADSTALRPEARRTLLEIGRRAGVPVYLIVFDVDEERCYYHDTLRARRVGRPVIARQVQALREALKTIPREGFDHVTVLDDALARSVSVELVPTPAAPGVRREAPGDEAACDQQESARQGGTDHPGGLEDRGPGCRASRSGGPSTDVS
jgi:predicted kinase